MLAPPLAGSLGYGFRAFVAYDVLAAASWSALAIGAGLLFHEQVDQLLAMLAKLLEETMLLFAALTLSGLLAGKAWQHRRWPTTRPGQIASIKRAR